MSSIVGEKAIVLYTPKKKMTSPKSGRENFFLHKSNENISRKKKGQKQPFQMSEN